MPSDPTGDAHFGIRLNIEAIADFTKDATFEQFAADRLIFLCRHAGSRGHSEASRRLPDDLKVRYPEIRWRAIHDAGNVYRHTYSKVSVANVRDAARRQLDDLKEIAIQELGTPDPPEPASTREDKIDEGSKE